MRFSLGLISLLLLAGCATVTGGDTQEIAVSTTPAGAHCTLSNNLGSATIAKTPGTGTVSRSYSPLKISCSKSGLSGGTMLEPKTRGRAYGNILLLGLPAIVDAGTGAGYEYSPDSADITLQTK